MTHYDEHVPWSRVPDKFVCGKCLDDEALIDFVECEASSNRCSYCGQKAATAIAAPIDALIEKIVEGIETEYTDPANELPYESAEGGYLGEVTDSWDLVDGLGITSNNKLLDDIRGSLRDMHWCKRNYFSRDRDEVLQFSWDAFKQAVMHKSRYFFMQPRKKRDEWDTETIPPEKMLDAIGRLVNSLEMLVPVPMGTIYYRARVHDSTECPTTAAELGPPSTNQAIFANRMSAAGIPMFYGAENRKTAEMEALDPGQNESATLTSVRFHTAKMLQVLDLASTIRIPSIFEGDDACWRDDKRFLWEFARDIAKRIKKDGREHIEYVPTQVLTEYFRTVFKRISGFHQNKFKYKRGIDGIRYRSSLSPDGVCVVIFADQDNCCDMNENGTYPKQVKLVMDAISARSRRL